MEKLTEGEMAPKQIIESASVRAMKIGIVVAMYWFVSITMVFMNKYLFSGTDFKLDAPLFITWYQCVVSVLLSWGCLIAVKKQRPAVDIKWLGITPEVDTNVTFDIAKKILPLSICFVGMVTFNNLCIKHVTVSFYTVSRSLSTVFNVVLTYIILHEKTSFRVILTCGIIVAGFLLGVDQEDRIGTLSWLGVFYGVAASIFVPLNAVFTTRVMPFVHKSPMKLTLYNNVLACFLFLPLIICFGEIQQIMAFKRLWDVNFWFCMTAGGFLGWSIAIVTSLQIMMTTPLTHTVSGTAKACTQTLLAVVWYSEVKTALWWTSNALVMLGSTLYAIVRRREMEDKVANERAAKQQQQQNEEKKIDVTESVLQTKRKL